MLRKLIAGLLTVLAVLPFTAPFATVDMGTLFGIRSAAAPRQTTLAPSVDDGSHALVAPSARVRTRLRSVLRVSPDDSTNHAGSPVFSIVATSSSTDSTLPARLSLTPLRI
jgi:hypothetical protein